MATTDSYRIAVENKTESSSEEGELSSDGEIEVDTNSQHGAMDTIHSSVQINDPTAKRRPKNIWSQVLADQSSNDISSSLGTVGMKGLMSRYEVLCFHFVNIVLHKRLLDRVAKY